MSFNDSFRKIWWWTCEFGNVKIYKNIFVKNIKYGCVTLQVQFVLPTRCLFCCNCSAGALLNVRCTTSGICAKNNTCIDVARTSWCERGVLWSAYGMNCRSLLLLAVAVRSFAPRSGSPITEVPESPCRSL